MTVAITWRDETGYRQAALRLLAWGAVAGLLIFVVSPPESARLASLAAGFPAALAAGCLVARWRRGEALSLAHAIAIALAGAIAQYGWARWYGSTLAATPVPAMVAGAAVGLIISLGHLPGALCLVSRRVEVQARQARKTLLDGGQAEMAALVAQATGQWTMVRESLRGDAASFRSIEQAMLRLLAEAGHWARSAPGVALPTAAAIEERLARIDGMLGGVRDPVARAQLAQTRRTIEAQRRHLADIEQNRERALAHMHRYVAAMERLHLAMLSQRSADATCRATVLQPIVDDLVGLAEVLDARTQEVDKAAQSVSSPPGG